MTWFANNATEDGNCEICDNNPCICEVGEVDYYDNFDDEIDEEADVDEDSE